VRIARSAPFEWSVLAFVFLCLVVSGFSIWRWLRRPAGKSAPKVRRPDPVGSGLKRTVKLQ